MEPENTTANLAEKWSYIRYYLPSYQEQLTIPSPSFLKIIRSSIEIKLSKLWPKLFTPCQTIPLFLKDKLAINWLDTSNVWSPISYLAPLLYTIEWSWEGANRETPEVYFRWFTRNQHTFTQFMVKLFSQSSYHSDLYRRKKVKTLCVSYSPINYSTQTLQLYKKILANRLMPYILHLFHLDQTGFML